MTVSHAKGFSLIELMVALLLGVVITLAATQMFAGNSRAFNLQQAQSQVQEEGTLLMRFLADDIRMAGLFGDDTAAQPGVVFAPITVGGKTLLGSGEGGSAGDSITFTFVGDQDCLGNNASSTLIAQRYFLNNGGLFCDSSLAAAAIELLPNVEAFEVLYGIREGDETPPVISRYVTANQVGDRPVMAVKLAVLLSKEAGLPASVGETVTYRLLDQSVTRAVDSRLRRAFQRTVALRNFPWEA